MDNVVQAVSLVGAGLILSAFFLVQRGRWRAKQAAYLWFNLLGSALLTVVAVWDERVGFIALEGAWALISLWGLIARGGSRRPEPD